MKNLKSVIIILLLLILGHNTFANVRIKDISIEGRDTVQIKYKGKLEQPPKLSIKDSILQVAIPGSVVWPKIEKKSSLRKSFDTTLMAYQFEKDMVRFRAILPFSLAGKEDKVKMDWKEDLISVYIPRSLIKKKKIETYDEGYLELLLKEREEKQQNENGIQRSKDKQEKDQKDEVSMAFSGNKKEIGGDKKFEMTGYVAKFTGFLIVVIALFFFIVGLFKKGVLKKGKLGFLNNTDLITVLCKSYLGPKNNLMVVKVHEQVFLLATSEKGVHFLSELTGMAGLLKNGEAAVSGKNFDTTFNKAKKTDKEFKLKEGLQELEQKDKKDTVPKDQVKLSDRIKKKVKELRPL